MVCHQASDPESEPEEERPVNVIVSDDYDPYFLKSIDGTVYR